ncbi:MAG: HAD-IIIC family phosphatase [Hyphomicrobiaceae bacterium]
MTCVLKPASDELRDAVLSWRNSPAVRRTMITQDVIPPDAHARWWERVKEDRTKRVLVLLAEQQPVGIINFFDVTATSAWWGFYPAEGAAGEGGAGGLQAWLALEQAALIYAFDVLGIDELLCETRHDNTGVLVLHDRLGFETLPREPYPNAVAHNLIVKRMTRPGYQQARNQDELPLSQQLTVERHRFDQPAAEPSAQREPAVRLAVIGSANWDIAARELAASYEAWTGHSIDVYTPPFGQGTMQLLDPVSALRGTARDFWIFAERLEDLCGPFDVPGTTDEAVVRERFERHVASIRRARGELKGTFLVHDMWPVRPRPQTVEEMANGSDAAARLCNALNGELAQLCSELPDTQLVPISSLIREVGARNADPGKYWLLGRVAYGKPLVESWSALVAGIVLAKRGQTARVLVLDLDNTLWGGVIGDDGMAGIEISSDYPGNEFKAMQHAVLSLKARGIPLTVSSKNTEHVALEAIRKHPEMVLRDTDLVAWRINWQPKSLNIREIASELSLGLGSLMFIDDNPVERAEVRRNCPGLIVPEMPEDVALWPAFLLSHPALTAVSLSAEDLGRAKSYEIRRQIVAAEQQAPSREAFLKELGMTLEVMPAASSAMQRVSQLVAKTNQFNTTTKRYSAADIAAKMAGGGDVLTLRLKDKFGSDEVIGVVLVDYDTAGRTAQIDNFVMSCRVLGRGVEAGAMAVVSERALRRGCDRLAGRIVPTERNEPCRSLYSDNGFADRGDLAYERALQGGSLSRPEWLTIATDE